MKFTCSVEIHLPVKEVVRLFDNPDNLGHWQIGLKSYHVISGKPGEQGTKATIIIHQGKHVIELTETILTRNLPEEMSALYEHKHMVNTMSNRFYKVDENKTRYEAEIHYTKFIGVVPKLMSLLMPGMFRRQVQKTLEQFKLFAESHANG